MQAGKTDIVQILLNTSGILVNEADVTGNTPLHTATRVREAAKKKVHPLVAGPWTYHVKVCRQVFLLACYNIFQKKKKKLSKSVFGYFKTKKKSSDGH